MSQGQSDLFLLVFLRTTTIFTALFLLQANPPQLHLHYHHPSFTSPSTRTMDVLPSASNVAFKFTIAILFVRYFVGIFTAIEGLELLKCFFECNILALGSGLNPQYLLNKVMIQDDHQSQCIGKLLFRSEVRSVKLCCDRIMMVLEQRIVMYNFAN